MLCLQSRCVGFLAVARQSVLCALFAAAALAGCASDLLLAEANNLYLAGRYEDSLDTLKRGYESQPDRKGYRTEYMRQRDLVITRMLAQAESARLGGNSDAAEGIYQRILRIDGNNTRASSGIAAIAADRRHVVIIAGAEKLLKESKADEAMARLRPVLAENPGNRDARALQRRIEEQSARDASTPPSLKPALDKPITLEFREANIRSVFEVISRTAGVNFVFDRDVRPDLRTTIFVKDSSIGEVIDLLLITNQLEKRVLNEKTVLIYPNNPAKRRDYQELVVKSFFLANADPKQTLNLIKTIVKTRDVFIDEKLNLMVMRDTPEAIRLAERLVASQDLAEPEVVLQVEVLEVSASNLELLGIQWPQQLRFSLIGGAGIPGELTLPEFQNLTSQNVRVGITTPSVILNLSKQQGLTNLLANPRIRVKNREKAKIHIGDRVPVITTTAAATGGFVSQSVTYLDVGLKLEVESNVYLDNEVGMKVTLEVSNIVKEVTGSGSSAGTTLAYQIGTRNANTVLRLKDGETQVLAGLISDEDRRTLTKVPGLGDFPVLGRLFRSDNTTAVKSEIVLLITPHIVRAVERPEARNMEFLSGTESSVGMSGGSPTPASAPIVPAAPAVQGGAGGLLRRP